MKNKSKTIWIWLLVIFSGTHMAYAGGGWPQPKGKGYFKLSEWWLISDQHYTDTGLIDPNITIGIFNTSLYAEYGFTNRLTGVLYLPFFSRSYYNNQISATTGELITPGEAINSLGDSDISLKYGLSSPGSPIAVSASVLFGLPLGKDSGGALNNLQTGDGEFNQMLRLDAGTSFVLGPIPAYVNLYSGFNNRTNDFSDEFRYGVEYGMGFLDKKWWINAKLDAVVSLKNGVESGLSNSTTIFANNAEYTSLTLESAFYVTSKVGFSISYSTALNGKIILANPSYSVGVFLDLK